jgi:F-type H+-transporting ATPase subunit a
VFIRANQRPRDLVAAGGHALSISPDSNVIAQWGPVTLNATIVFTWLVMALLAIGSWLVTRRLSPGTRLTRGQNLLEVVVSAVQGQIREVSRQEPGRYLPFVGTLFLFIAASNLLSIVPGYQPPTGSLSTTAALALCVFVAVPLYGIWQQGLRGYLRQYLRPSPIMLPFNIIGEFSRTLALAVRLFGNVMSGSMIVAILLSIVPLFFPIVMQALGLLIGFIQAYVFAMLAMVYIASATRAHHGRRAEPSTKGEH